MEWRLPACLGALVVTGMAMHPLEEVAWRETVRRLPAGERRGPAGTAGPGIALGLLGGFRALAADLLWLQTNAHWERCDIDRTRAAVALVTAVDPRPVVFWLNGARMLAYDVPYWRIEAFGGEAAVPPGVARHIREEQARAAIGYLEQALVHHPAEPRVRLEIAQLELHLLHDTAAAAVHYREAALQPGAPYYAARLHAALLCDQGRERAAYDWLVALHPTLPPEAENPAAMADTVLARIRELEDRLALAPAARYQPGRK